MFGGTPPIIEQLHSLHILAYGVVTAEVFAALPNKTKRVYIRYLRILNEKVSDISYILKKFLFIFLI